MTEFALTIMFRLQTPEFLWKLQPKDGSSKMSNTPALDEQSRSGIVIAHHLFVYKGSTQDELNIFFHHNQTTHSNSVHH